MAQFLRGKQAGIQNDLSAGIAPALFTLDDQARLGIPSQISTLAYEPIQSLLAVGTHESPLGSGQILVYGQKRVQQTFRLPRKASVKILKFCSGGRLISIDSKNEIVVWDLQNAKQQAAFGPPGVATSLETDPILDWAYIGLQNGSIVFYDLERERLAPLRLPNFWREKYPKSRLQGVVSMQSHPRDIGQLLIGYTDGAVLYSFKQNGPIKYFEYELPPGAPGGSYEPITANTARKPRLCHVAWHPTGTFILTGYEDSSLVVWDPKDGRIVMARTLEDTHINEPGRTLSGFGNTADTFSLKDRFTRIAWCAKQNPDDTGILIAGGAPATAPQKGLTFLELGITPVYNTSTWPMLTDHFEAKRQHLLQTPPAAEVVDFCLIPRLSPHFAGAQDPIAVLALLSSGEIMTLTFPSGHQISPTNQLPPSLCFVHPFVTTMAFSAMERSRWLGMTETRSQGPPILQGGAEGIKPMKRHEARNVVQIAHGDGTIRIFDAGHGDELENSASLQVDVARALARYEDVDITLMSMASATGELAAGTRAGEVVIYRWGGNKLFGREASSPTATQPGGLTNITERSEPALKEGLQPFVLYDLGKGPVSALKMSDVGFVGVGSENGAFSIIDLRGPAVIYTSSINDLIKENKRSSLFRKGDKSPGLRQEWPLVIEFGVMSLEGDEYSSICCFVGTNMGRVATFKVLPGANGSYSAQFVASTSLNDRVISICPIIASSGKPALASGAAVAGLRDGQQVHGSLVVVTQSEVRIFKPAAAKGAHKTFDDFLCESANVVDFELDACALVCIFSGGQTRAYSIPALKEIETVDLPMLDKSRLSNSIVTRCGDIFGWTGPSEIAMLNVWGSGQQLPYSQDKLFDPQKFIPPRPTISNIQWLSGTQYVSPTDLDLLIGGPDRPPSKRMMAATAEEARQARANGGRGTASASGGRAGTSEEGWGEYMTRQLNERTEKLNIMGDSMDNLQESSSQWSEDVSKYVSKTKRGIIMKGLFG